MPLLERERQLVPILDRITPEQTDHFWSLVDWSGGDDACWPWRGPFDAAGGLPVFPIGAGKGSYARASALRVAWTLVHGEEPQRAIVRHTCGTRHCVNPKHLAEGVGHEFVISRKPRRRGRTEPNMPEPVETRDPMSAEAIRARVRAGETLSAIAHDLDAPLWLVGRVLRGAPAPTVCPVCGATNPRGVCHCNVGAFAGSQIASQANLQSLLASVVARGAASERRFRA